MKGLVALDCLGFFGGKVCLGVPSYIYIHTHLCMFFLGWWGGGLGVDWLIGLESHGVVYVSESSGRFGFSV